MVIIDQETQDISITRGDYATLVFVAYEDDGITMHDLADGDIVQLQISKKYGASNPITKTREKVGDLATTEDDYSIILEPADTKNLKFGDYVYDVSILSGDSVCTYIGDTGENQPKFTILKEVGGVDG